ncbi:hypothetical protein KP509_07G007300 [Ceratopteris richardii]|uniref:Thaumatin-like protein n=1 Tax=Ceratopteris richardii TaxID=49495 RepID=A0A8T2UFL3_CERRI|nr:hypothetical protein KP509_07G007300 [Ceratopteris richardii]
MASASFSSLLLLLCCCFADFVHGNGGSSGHRNLQFVNKCKEEVWVGALGSSVLNGGGWAMAPGEVVMVQAPAGWHGRFWGRTGCSFNHYGVGKCETGDCGGLAQCGGIGGQPPATLAELSLGPPLDYYDVSLVDGYNLRVSVQPRGSQRGSRTCRPAGCNVDVNAMCPAALRVAKRGSSGVVACRSACTAFSRPEFCCTGAYAQPSSCRPSYYSRLFKRACPRAYSYAFDDPSSIFTCSKPHSYLISFCS